jgi:hypothetical protein
MSTYAVSMDCPHATTPAVLWRVMVFDDVAKTGAEMPGHKLWVPELGSWTLDTLRMVLHELAAYLPAHDSATVTIKARTGRASGGQGRSGGQRLVFKDRETALSVSARGWTATVWTWRNEATDKDGKFLGRGAGDWSKPMQAVLLDLAAHSPFPLDTVRVVDCADPYDLQLKYPARRDVVRGVEPPDGDRSVLSRLKEIEQRIDDILGDES